MKPFAKNQLLPSPFCTTADTDVPDGSLPLILFLSESVRVSLGVRVTHFQAEPI